MNTHPLAIVAALDDEFRTVLNGMDVDSRIHVRPALLTLGRYRDQTIVLLRSGVGPEAMRRAMSELLSRFSPGMVLHVGSCGSAHPAHQSGDLIIASHVVSAITGERFLLDPMAREKAVRTARRADLRATVGGLVTVAAPVLNPHGKAFAGTHHEVDGIDMESADCVAAARTAGIPVVVVRAVLDTLDDTLPDMTDVLAPDGHADGSKLASHLGRKPRDIFALPHMAFLLKQSMRALECFLTAWFGPEEDKNE